MRTIGFISAPMAEKPKAHNMDNRLFTFDSGRGITFEEATRSTLVMGGTGSGKTSSLVLPMCRNLIKAGFAGLIIPALLLVLGSFVCIVLISRG